MSTLEEQFENACNAKELPGVVLLAADKTGNFNYAKTFGEKRPGEKMDLDATFIFASCTKLMTSISVLQCVEKGLITLDEDVSSVLTELKDAQILTGYGDDGKPVMKPATTKITLRHLLTHSSGFAYDMMSPDLMRWRTERGQTPGTHGLSRTDRLDIPLLYEPGTSWMYGSSIDFVGVIVSRLSGVTLEEYMQKNIWDVLGIKNITFHEELKPDVQKNLVQMMQREGVPNPSFNIATEKGKKALWSELEIYPKPYPLGDEMGGQGTTGNPLDFLEILKSILADDGRLLKSSTINQMFTPQFTPAAKAGCAAWFSAPMWKDTFSSHEAGVELDWGLAGQLTESDKATGRKKGSLTWSGLPNLLWTIDREAGLVTFYASNIVPFGDLESQLFQQAFEKEMYSRAASGKANL